MNNITRVFTESVSEKTTKIFLQSKEELDKEFRDYKAKKFLTRLDYAIINSKLLVEDFIKECTTAITYGFNSVTVLPNFIPLAKKVLYKTKIKVNALISYPFGEDDVHSKIFSTKRAVRSGVDGIILTISSFEVKNGEYAKILKECLKVVWFSRKRNVSILIDTDNISTSELENLYHVLSKDGKIYSLMPYSTNGQKTTSEMVKTAIKSVSGKTYIDAFGSIDNVKESMNLILDGANSVSSTKCTNLAITLQNQINDL